MSIQALKESLPELTDEKFKKLHRHFFLRALGPVLGYERAKGGENWDEILDVFEAERERRYGPGEVVAEAQRSELPPAPKEAQEEEPEEMIEDLSPEERKELIESLKAAKQDPEVTQQGWESFCQNFSSKTSCKLFRRREEDS